MKWIKLFEDFKQNNEESTLISEDDIIKCIQSGGMIKVSSYSGKPEIKNLDEATLKPQSIEEGEILCDFEGHEYEVDLKDVVKIEM
jgi:hypothetical protein